MCRFISAALHVPPIFTAFLFFLLLGSNGLGVPLRAQDTIDFGSQIKPILADKCFACHGPDEAQRATDFRLDVKKSALDPEAFVIVPTKPSESLLVQRILSDDPDEVMPPTDHLKRLSKSEKQLLVKWIEQGADWSKHWAFVLPTRKNPPKFATPDSSGNFIDQFVQSKLHSNNLAPSGIAEPHTLLRRLSFDLTGLAPTPKQVSNFMTASENEGLEVAYSAEVDRLLASSRYGERMAVGWLDLVRYADTVGYHGDQNVSVSPYRDYVIEAFNANMPFDRFTREQIAGDLIPNATQEQQIASGYNRLGMMSAEGGVQPKEYLNKYASDRVRTTSSVWLGVTLGCAECHDHKFDPFTTKEFYEFSAFFADIKEQGLYAGASRDGKFGTSIDVADDDLAELLAPVEKRIESLTDSIVSTEEVQVERVAWERKLSEQTEWSSLAPQTVKTLPDANTSITPKNTVLVSGPNPNQVVYGVLIKLPSGTSAVRLEALPHASLPNKGPGRAGNGNFVVSEFILLKGDHTESLDVLQNPSKDWTDSLRTSKIALTNASASVQQTQGGESHPDKKWSAASTIDDDKHGKTWGWAVLPETGKSQELVVQLTQPLSDTTDATVIIRQQHSNPPHTLGHFGLSQTDDANATSSPIQLLPPPIQVALAVERSARTEAQIQTIADYYLTIAPRYAGTRKQLAELEQERSSLVKSHTRKTLVTVSVPPREIRVLARGDWMDMTGDIVMPGVPSALGDLTLASNTVDAPRATRVELANWLVDQRNPLTSRVFVNRVWRMLFGSGLANTLDDLGTQGETPSHPELLDALAVEFVESGWDIKRLIRQMVLSRTYQQSSSHRDEIMQLDPENRLLARQSRFRLDAEFIRDHALSVSGLLVEKIGGKSVMPYQPAGLYRHLNFPTRKYQASQGEDQYRRGLYTHWQRQFLHPAMKTFDAPAREECTAARSRSSTPLAALVMLNDPSYVEAARAMADQVLGRPGDAADKIKSIFESAFSRGPAPEELAVVAELLETHLKHYQSNPDEAKQLVSIGLSGMSANTLAATPNVTLAERAAWTSVCRAVFNMHEFVLRK
ncbi:MAG: hypothetical protein ACI87E_002678 [Mariniblastus sp.]|jgi:hypothetical protein